MDHGFTWAPHDATSPRWWPQGITTASDAAGEDLVHGRRLLLTSSYSRVVAGSNRGCRITVVDLDTLRYRNVLLVVPRGPGGPRRFDPLLVHAGGIAWTGPYLHVAGTRRGILTCRLEDLLHAQMEAKDNGQVAAAASGALVCVLDPERSRVTGPAPEDLPFDWSPSGCVNARTQYGFADGVWSRVLVPDEEAMVSVNSFDPATREYRVERYLLDREAMERVRKARGEVKAPACGADRQAALDLGAQQTAIVSLLPERPNERLVYKCAPKG